MPVLAREAKRSNDTAKIISWNPIFNQAYLGALIAATQTALLATVVAEHDDDIHESGGDAIRAWRQTACVAQSQVTAGENPAP